MTHYYRLKGEEIKNFNSHAHVERDLEKIVATLQLYKISTHTLTWSVTYQEDIFPYYNNDFNSHAHVERDSGFATGTNYQEAFQLTRSRGA